MKKYRAIYETSSGSGEYEFYSEHKRGSKANMTDAIKTAQRKFGYAEARKNKIVQIDTLYC